MTPVALPAITSSDIVISATLVVANAGSAYPNVVVQYTYDAWGKQLSCTGTKASTIGYWQPFRYRGYRPT